MDILYEGKAKRLYATAHPSELRMEFKDDATAFNGLKHEVFAGKGRINKSITLTLFSFLEAAGIPTHLLRDEDETRLIVRKIEIIPIEFVVRNVVAGSLAQRTGWAEGTALPEPLVEFYYKNDALGDPMLAPDHIRVMGLANAEEVDRIRSLCLRINQLLMGFMQDAGFRLIDFKLEFGRDGERQNQIVLADEISPDTCRIHDLATDEILDKDRFRRDLGGVMEGYQRILEAIRNHAAQR